MFLHYIFNTDLQKEYLKKQKEKFSSFLFTTFLQHFCIFKKRKHRTWVMAQVVVCLPSKCKALSSKPSTAKKKLFIYINIIYNNYYIILFIYINIIYNNYYIIIFIYIVEGGLFGKIKATRGKGQGDRTDTILSLLVKMGSSLKLQSSRSMPPECMMTFYKINIC
jgi:hypothetical protein